MTHFTDITGLAGVVCAMMAAFTQLPGIARLTRPRLALGLVAVVLLMLTPLEGLPLAAYVRGVIGDLSIASMVLLLYAIRRPLAGGNPVDAKARLGLQALIALAATMLYPLALGIGLFDPYRLGYGDPWFMGALLLLALSAWFWRLYLIALCIAFAVLAWSTGWYESTNLWDYLLDPLVSIYAVSSILLLGVKTLWRWRRGRPSESQPSPPI